MLGERGSIVVEALCYKLEGLRPDEVNMHISSIYEILPAAPGPGAYSASDRNEYQKQKIMFLGSRARPVHQADNLTTICEPTV
jgi:hypothetical protein